MTAFYSEITVACLVANCVSVYTKKGLILPELTFIYLAEELIDR